MLNIQTTEQPSWTACEMRVTSMGTSCFLMFRTDTLTVAIGGNRQEMIRKLEEVLDRIDPPTPQRQTNLKPMPQTRQEVVTYFEASTVLAPHAKDVRDALQVEGIDPMIEEARQSLDLDSLFDDQGEPVRGARARIAEFLGKPDAGSYRRQITDILAGISPTTTPKPAQNAQKCA